MPTPANHSIGDGLDFRQPSQSATLQAQEHTTIDLTLDDDDDENDTTRSTTFTEQSADSQPRRSQRHGRPRPLNIDDSPYTYDTRRAPRTTSQAEVIEIADDQDQEQAEATEDSSDVEILEVRAAPERPLTQQREPRLTSLQSAFMQSIASPMTQAVAGYVPLLRASDYGQGGILTRMSRIMTLPAFTTGGIDLEADDDFDVDEYNDITLNYGAVGFDVFNGGIGDDAGQTDDYKPPTAPKTGFTRDIEEEGDVLVCAACEDELATGEQDDIKSQVWVVKKCGHVSFSTLFHLHRASTLTILSGLLWRVCVVSRYL